MNNKLKEILFSLKVNATIFFVLFFIYIIINSNDIKGFILGFDIKQHLSFFILITLLSSITLFLKNKISYYFPETKKGLNYISIIFFITMIVTYRIYYIGGDKYQSSIALLISSVFIGSGWWVQATINKVAARKSHTLNILMIQRNSEIFHKKNRNVCDVFGFTKTINESIAKCQVSPSDKNICNKVLKKIYKEAVADFVYLLNYYEFICSGINNGDFDEFLMKDCLSAIIPKLELRGYHIILLSRDKIDKECFENLVKVIDKWTNGGSLILRHDKGDKIRELNYIFDSEEDLFDE